MADKHTYTVHRAMHGDGRDYARGDTRELSGTDAAPLLATGALSLKGKDPAEREPAVRHTFGKEPTGYTDYTDPTDASVSVADRRAIASPFDHDGDGNVGGSAKGADSTRAKGAAKRKS